MSTVKTSNVQLGNGADNVNFTWRTPSTPNGTIKLVRGSASGTSYGDLITIDSFNNVYLPTATAVTQTSTDNTTALATTAFVRNSVATAKAWVTFTPSTGTIIQAHNVWAVTRNAAGQYFINMNVTFTSASSYAVVALAGQDAAGNGAAGQNNTMMTGSRTVSGFTLNAWEAGNSLYEDPGIISVVVFGA